MAVNHTHIRIGVQYYSGDTRVHDLLGRGVEFCSGRCVHENLSSSEVHKGWAY